MPQFSHLHVHSQFSLLDGAAGIKDMMDKAKDDGMKAIALTDHGNMFGAFQFVNEANKAGIKPIVGCEFYVVEDRHQRSFTKGAKDRRYHQLILAKNQEGYKNLSRLCSLGFIEGLYSKFPRIDRELILKYKEGLIATTCCIGAEVPQTIIKKGEEAGEKVFREWLEIFGDDYYIELQRHHLKNIDNSGMSQEDVNQILLKWSVKYNVPVIATNDSHYVEEEDYNAHDILLCVNTGDFKSTPVGDGKGYRFGFPNSEFYFKTQEEMNKLFGDIPQAIDNTNLIVDKITAPQLQRDIMLPNYAMPDQFQTQDDYLKYLTFEGAKRRYGELTAEIVDRLNYELNIIKDMGFPGYFLIVQDFTSEARRLGVSVGPGRGSAAGSAVAYCIGITNIDPIKYNLLFERFLNPERVSMPDIDIDFDDEGRGKVIDYVVEKYGKNKVAQIITFGTMAAKSSIRDVGRVLNLPLQDVDRICKTFPNHLSASLGKVLKDGGVDEKLKSKLNSEQVGQAEAFRKLAAGNDLAAQTIQQAKALEGSVRNTGTHACGVIISPEDLVDVIPLKAEKNSELYITQFDNAVVESAGLLKMDFLGLKTLSIIKNSIELIEERHGVKINEDDIPLDDELTFKLFQEARTNGIFQFESTGMKKYLRELKPTDIEDLIAMNALFRPGPMDHIPSYIKRKHGREKINYPHELLEPILKNTNGIMVYQEQIMEAARVLGGYSLGGADLLRRAMGKKKMDVMIEQREIFKKGALEKNGIAPEKADEIFDLMIKFAEYGFNRSHSAGYALVAYHTAYLKAHYPAEYMAAVLTNNMNDIKKVTFFMEEARRMNVKVLGPDINESEKRFTVNKNGEVRFGMAAVKGIGEAAVEEIVRERKENGLYSSLFDMLKRVNLRTVNKKTLESLVLAGGNDGFKDFYRSQFFHIPINDTLSGLEKMIKAAGQYQESVNASQHSLFADSDESVSLNDPKLPDCEPWNKMELLRQEKDVIGIYLSGHPLDPYKLELQNFCSHDLESLKDLSKLTGREVSFAGIVANGLHLMTKGGRPYGRMELEDYTDSITLFFYREDYLKNKHFLDKEILCYVRAKVIQGWNEGDPNRLQVTNISLLPEIRKTMTKKLTLKIDMDKITNERITTLEQLLRSNPGKTPVCIKILDQESGQILPMRSRNTTVGVEADFFKALEKEKLPYQIN